MPPNGLAQETVDAVRLAVQRYASDGSPPGSASELRAALHAFAQEARAKGIPPEHLLVTLKAIWQMLPEIKNARDQTEKTRILQRVVTICIHEYFAE